MATNPLTRERAIDLYFMEHRAKLIDIAAFLDRVERSRGQGPEDFRMEAFGRALAVLSDGRPDRARRVLEVFSDHSTEPVPVAGMKGATGACPPPEPPRSGGDPSPPLRGGSGDTP